MKREEQKELIQVVNFVHQKTDLIVIHIANEGKRSALEGMLLKKMGMVKGVSDLFFPRSHQSANYKGLWIEYKTLKGRLMPEQKKFLQDMIDDGYQALTCWGVEAAIQSIKGFYGIK